MASGAWGVHVRWSVGSHGGDKNKAARRSFAWGHARSGYVARSRDRNAQLRPLSGAIAPKALVPDPIHPQGHRNTAFCSRGYGTLRHHDYHYHHTVPNVEAHQHLYP